MGDIKITGLDRLQKKLRSNCTMNAVRRVVKQNGAELQTKMQEKAPVGTPESTGIPGYVGGTLKRSIILGIEGGGMTAKVNPTVEYAPYVEYGTRFMEAKPYVKPALEEQKIQFKQDMSKLTK